MTVNDFQFCGGDIDRIDLTEPVLDTSQRLRGLTIAWAKETILEMGNAASIDTGVNSTFSRSITAAQMNNMLEGMKRLCPDDTSLRGSNVFRFVNPGVELFGPNRAVDLGDGRFQDSWEASQLYGREISQYVSGSPFYSSSFSVQSANNVFGGSSYQRYVRTLSRGDKLDYFQLAYTFAEPFRLRLSAITRHFNSSQLGQMYANPIYTVTAGGVISARAEVIPKTKTTIPSGISPYRFPSTYIQPGQGTKWHVLRITENVIDWDTQRTSKSVVRDVLVKGMTGSDVVSGSDLLNCINNAFGILGISDSDIVEPTQAQVESWRIPPGAPLPYGLHSLLEVSYIGCYTVDYLRDRTITPWQRH